MIKNYSDLQTFGNQHSVAVLLLRCIATLPLTNAMFGKVVCWKRSECQALAV